LRFVAVFLISFLLIGDIVTYVDENGRIVVTNVNRPKKKRKKLKRRNFRQVNSSIYDYIINEKARKYGVEPSLIRAIIAVESGFNPRAVSRKGAIGLMQLMPSTASLFGARDPFDPEQNIEAGVRYLRYLIKKFGNKRLAVAAYNAGETAVKRYNGIPPYRETKNFVSMVMRLHNMKRKTIIYRCIGKSGSVVLSNSPPLPEECAGQIEVIK